MDELTKQFTACRLTRTNRLFPVVKEQPTAEVKAFLAALNSHDQDPDGLNDPKQNREIKS